MNFPLDRITFDHSVQSREATNTETVNEYAERMQAGDAFPPVVLFGSVDNNALIGDGWHRVLAAKQIGLKTIDADLRPGGKREARACAVAANADNGLPRTNADKRRCVLMALEDNPTMTDVAIAMLCRVTRKTVGNHRPENGGNLPPRIRSDGRTVTPPGPRRPAPDAPDPPAAPEKPEDEEDKPERVNNPKPSNGMNAAREAVTLLSRIQHHDTERDAALAYVAAWIEAHRRKA
jgi:hypothetical protein